MFEKEWLPKEWELTIKACEEISWGEENVLYLGLCGGNMGVCNCSHSLKWTFKMGTIYSL